MKNGGESAYAADNMFLGNWDVTLLLVIALALVDDTESPAPRTAQTPARPVAAGTLEKYWLPDTARLIRMNRDSRDGHATERHHAPGTNVIEVSAHLRHRHRRRNHADCFSDSAANTITSTKGPTAGVGSAGLTVNPDQYPQLGGEWLATPHWCCSRP